MRIALALALASAVAGCASDPPAAPLRSGTSVEITGAPADGVLLEDGQLQLRAVVRSSDGVEVVGARVDWSSTDGARATVSGDGLVRGIRTGDVAVRANSGGASAQRALSVRVGVPLPGGGPPLTSTLLDGAVRITLAAGAVPAGAVLHLRAATDPPSTGRLVSGTAVELGPTGLQFGAPVTLALAIPSSVAAAERTYLRLHVLTNGDWSLVPGSSVDLVAGRAQGAITRAGTYALLRRADAAALRIDGGNTQFALPGGFVPVAPRVLVRDATDRPVEGVVVRFAVSGGGGAIVGDDTGLSDAAGLASLPGAWRLGPSAGANALTATALSGSAPPVTFTATAEAVTLVITRQLAGAVSGRVATTQPRLEFRTASGVLLPVSDGVTAQLLAGTGALVGTRTVNAINGVATFADLRLDGSGVHRLRFVAGGSGADGASFTVTQELSALQVVVQPAGAVEDRVFATQPVIRLLDDAGLPYLTAKSVTASLASGPGDLRGNVSVTAAMGLATFANLRIDDATGTHTLRFQTTSPTRSVLSAPFTVIPR